MSLYLIGLFVFFAAHFAIAIARPLRQRIIDKIGEGPYKGLYALTSAVGLALIIFGWPKADVSLIYAAPAWGRHVAFLLMWIALILLVSAYAPAGRIAAAVKHPMLAGVKIWAFAHLLANGEVRSVLLFGLFLAFGVVDRISVKKRGAPTRPAGGAMNDVIAIGVGTGVYLAILFVLHPYIAGVALIAR